MKTQDLVSLFTKHADEFLKFDRIASPAHPRPDLCAFLMLHEIAPGNLNGSHRHSDMVACAAHDEIWLDTSVELLAEHASEAQIIDLIRCGIRFDRSNAALAMFV